MKHILVDLHTHLNEKKVNPKDWWEAVEEKKLSVIAITEHVEYNPREAYEKLLKIKPNSILLIPGMEARTTAGHLLIYGEDKSVYNIAKLQEVNIPIKDALEIIKENNLVASFAHPYGYKSDSTCHTLGAEKSKELIKKYKIGSEYYNGMLGSANNFIFGTQWIKKLYNFFDFVSKSKKAEKLGIENKSKKMKNKLEKISEETLSRVTNAIEFSSNSAYITVGSDAHYPRVIGTAIIELKRKPRNNKDFLSMLRKKQILWAGPNIYSKDPVDNLKKKELLQGLKYITKKKLKNKLKRKRKNKKSNKKTKKEKKNNSKRKRFSKIREVLK